MIDNQENFLSEGGLIKKALGVEWEKLHPSIQDRFKENPTLQSPLYYKGVMLKIKCSKMGQLLGRLMMFFIKGALLPFNDENVPVDVEVYIKHGCNYIFKKRTYHLNGCKPVEFTSYMKEGEAGKLLEYVGMGLGTELIASVRDHNLYFESINYFIEINHWRIYFPHILTPGKLTVFHGYDPDNPSKFSIKFDINHTIFGHTFSQEGVF